MIYRRDHLQPFLRELTEHYEALKRAVEGLPPAVGAIHELPVPAEREYSEVDIDQVLVRIQYFQVAVKHLSKIKSKAAKPVHRT